MSEIQLDNPSWNYKDSYIQAIKEYYAEGFLINKIALDEVEKRYDLYLKKIKDWEKGINLPEGFSPQTEMWLVEGDRYLGTVKIRHKLNKVLSAVGGHIGYYIRPTERKKGFGSLILQLSLPVAKRIGLSKVMLTCDESNFSSARIIEKNGGVFYSKSSNGTTEPRLIYWIEL